MAVPEAGLAGSKPEDRAKPVAIALDIILSSQGWEGMRAWPGSDGAYSLVGRRQPLWPLPETKRKGRTRRGPSCLQCTAPSLLCQRAVFSSLRGHMGVAGPSEKEQSWGQVMMPGRGSFLSLFQAQPWDRQSLKGWAGLGVAPTVSASRTLHCQPWPLEIYFMFSKWANRRWK